MTYTIITYDNLNIVQKDLFFNFLQEARKETTQPAYINMWDDDWPNNTSTLPYLLEKTNRFKIGGKYHIAFDNDTVVGCSGVYTSTFCPELAIAGTRTWITKAYRNLSVAREVFLPIEKDWAISNNFKAIGICFNDYNKNIIKIWNRLRLGEERSQRQPHHFCYNGVNEIPFPVTIQYTKQWIIYEKLQEDFNFDWNSIKWKH
jgi:hypothetical protein